MYIMLVGIIMNILDKIAKKFNIKGNYPQSAVTNPIEKKNSAAENEFLARMSKHAINLYEKQCDIKNFTKLVLSDPENTSHNQLVEDLLKDNVFDPLEDKVIEELANNEDLLKDLGL